MLFRDKLYNILDDLSKHKMPKSELFRLRVQERLDAALNSYNRELDNSLDYLKYRKDSLAVLKKMNRG